MNNISNSEIQMQKPDWRRPWTKFFVIFNSCCLFPIIVFSLFAEGFNDTGSQGVFLFFIILPATFFIITILMVIAYIRGGIKTAFVFSLFLLPISLFVATAISYLIISNIVRLFALPAYIQHEQSSDLIFNTQMICLDLRDYYKHYSGRISNESKQNYPHDLEEFKNNDSYWQSIAYRSPVGKERIESKYQYAVSPDYQHFVIYTVLPIPKDKIGLIGGETIDKVKGTVLGIECSDPRIFCSTDSICY